MNSIKINKLEIENVKRVKAVKVEPAQTGLTVIGGKNKQGKTSVLDAITWALGGNKFKPSDAQRRESSIPPYLNITLSNGLKVERKGKNSTLKVTDLSGNKAGQNLLDEFINQLALNLPKFMSANNSEKADTLLQIIGVGDKLYVLDDKEQKLYNQRLAIGQIADQKTKYAKEMLGYLDAPADLVSINDLIKQQQRILVKNGENQKHRDNLQNNESVLNRINNNILELENKLSEMKKTKAGLEEDIRIAKLTVSELKDESTEELEKNIADIETINLKVRANFDKTKAEDDAKEYKRQYDSLTMKIEKVRKERIDLLNNADLPLPGLSVVDGELTYNNNKWDCMSGEEQLKVSVAIVRKLKPDCGFVLMDKLEQMDTDSLENFNKWLVQEGLQVLATRVSTGEECSIIIEDGYVVEQENIIPAPPKFTKGEF